MRQVIISRPIEIVAGSGLALNATTATFGTPVISSEITISIETTDLTPAISTVIGLAVA